MGMYTEMVLAIELQKDAPEEVVTILKYLTQEDYDPEHSFEKPGHSFFYCERWKLIFRGDSYYFDGETHSIFKFDDVSNTWFLTTRSNVKNYGGELELFCEWLAPYIQTREFAGHTRYEGCEEPILLYFNNGKVIRIEGEAPTA